MYGANFSDYRLSFSLYFYFQVLSLFLGLRLSAGTHIFILICQRFLLDFSFVVKDSLA